MEPRIGPLVVNMMTVIAQSKMSQVCTRGDEGADSAAGRIVR